MEQVLQEINPNLSIPYQNASIDQSLNLPLWDANPLGQFNDDWNLNRNLNDFGSLPSPQDIVAVKSITNFFTVL